MSVRRALLPALTTLLLLLTGCGGGQSTADPPVLPPTSSATSQAPEPETPEHFIRRWAAEDIRIQRTGDTARFRTMSQGCDGCIELADHVDRIYAHGGFIHTGGWRVVKIVARSSRAFILHVYAAATVYKDSASAPKQHLPKGPAAFVLSLRRVGASWNVTSIVHAS